MKLPMRSIGASLSLALLLTTTAACSMSGQTVTPSQVSQDIALEAAGLKAAIAQLPATEQVNPAIQTALADLQAVATAFSDADAQATQQQEVSRIVTDINAIVAAASLLPLPAPVSTAFQAADVLLPIIEASVGFNAPLSAAPSAMTPEEARLVLRGA